MKDKIGSELNVGDLVLYIKRQDTKLYYATIESIEEKSSSAKVRNVKSGRVALLPRYSDELLSVKRLKEDYPESFI